MSNLTEKEVEKLANDIEAGRAAILVIDNVDQITYDKKIIKDYKRSKAKSLSDLEIRQKLSDRGLKRSAVYATLDTILDQDKKDDLLDFWEYTKLFHRNNESLIEFGTILGLSDTDLDEIWEIE